MPPRPSSLRISYPGISGRPSRAAGGSLSAKVRSPAGGGLSNVDSRGSGSPSSPMKDLVLGVARVSRARPGRESALHEQHPVAIIAHPPEASRQGGSSSLL